MHSLALVEEVEAFTLVEEMAFTSVKGQASTLVSACSLNQVAAFLPLTPHFTESFDNSTSSSPWPTTIVLSPSLFVEEDSAFSEFVEG